VSGTGLIVVGGEALIDLVPAGDGTLAAHPGGGPFNTARSLGRLERPVG
jgi:fructokinase